MPIAILDAMLNEAHAVSPLTRRPRVTSIVTLDGYENSALLALAASLARGLETPVAAAIVESAREREIPIRQADEPRHTTASGITASVAGHAVVLGNAALFTGLGLSFETLGDWPERLRQRGEQVLFVAVDGRTAGFLGVLDADE